MAPIVRDASLASIAILQLLIESLESMQVTQIGHIHSELRPVRSARITDNDFDVVAGMPIDESRNQVGMIGLVQDIAADHQVEFTELRVFPVPVAGLVLDWRQPVTENIPVEKFAHPRMIIAGRNIDTHLVQNDAAQPYSAADFEHPLTGQFELVNVHRHDHRRRPDLAEQGPGGIVDTELGCTVVRFVLLPVLERVDDVADFVDQVGLAF